MGGENFDLKMFFSQVAMMANCKLQMFAQWQQQPGM
jgi:hypothetical protein